MLLSDFFASGCDRGQRFGFFRCHLQKVPAAKLCDARQRPTHHLGLELPERGNRASEHACPRSTLWPNGANKV
jgi:hypothetical protein